MRGPTREGTVVLVAVEGWPDAAHAATDALALVRGDVEERPVPDLADGYFDLQIERPSQVPGPDGSPRIAYPQPMMARRQVQGRDVWTITTPEPTFRWVSFARELRAAILSLRPSLVCVVGSYVAPLPHTRPVRVSRTVWDEAQTELLGLPATRYRGPIGVNSVLVQELSDRRVPTAQLWAAVPAYLSDTFTPATVALLDAVCDLTGLELPLAALREQARRELVQHDAAVADSVEARAYVAQLERRHDAAGDGDALVDDVVAFLRQQASQS